MYVSDPRTSGQVDEFGTRVHKALSHDFWMTAGS
jgi:hypothetical protein